MFALDGRRNDSRLVDLAFRCSCECELDPQQIDVNANAPNDVVESNVRRDFLTAHT